MVDHILPVSEGGETTSCNLVAACRDCNAGKSDKLLTVKIEAMDVIRARVEAKTKELEAHNEWLERYRDRLERGYQEVSDYWITKEGGDPEEKQLSAAMEDSIKEFLNDLPVAVLKQTVDYVLGFESEYVTKFENFCRTCRKLIRNAKVDKAGNQ